MIVHFHLKRPSAATETAIIAKCHAQGHPLKIPTGLSIEPKKWDAKKQRAKRGTMNEALVNRRLEAITTQLNAIVLDLQHDGIAPTQQTVADRVRAGSRRPVETADLFTAYDDYLEQSKTRLRPRTLERHRTVKMHLQGFEKAIDVSVRFDRCDAIMFDRLVAYLFTQRLTSTSAWNIVKHFRAFLRWAHERGLSSNDEYLRYTQRRIPKGQQSTKPYLTLAELEAIQALELTPGSRLDKVRDLLTFQLWTGLRFGDLQTLRPEHVAGDAIHLVTGKNRKQITVPLLEQSAAIWRKYDGRLPKISGQKQNQYLQELARAAKITQPIVTVDYRGSERIERTVAKCDLLGTHSMKRSFVTIMRQRGVSVEALCKITGNDRRTIETYLVGTSDDASQEVRRAWKQESRGGQRDS